MRPGTTTGERRTHSCVWCSRTARRSRPSSQRRRGGLFAGVVPRMRLRMMGHIMRPSRAPAQVARLAGAQAIQPGGRRSLARVPLLLHDPRKRRVIAQRRRPRRWAILKRSEIASCLCSCACARSGTHIFPRSSLFALVSASSFASVRAWMRARACGAGGCACMGTVSLRCLCLRRSEQDNVGAVERGGVPVHGGAAAFTAGHPNGALQPPRTRHEARCTPGLSISRARGRSVRVLCGWLKLLHARRAGRTSQTTCYAATCL